MNFLTIHKGIQNNNMTQIEIQVNKTEMQNKEQAQIIIRNMLAMCLMNSLYHLISPKTASLLSNVIQLDDCKLGNYAKNSCTKLHALSGNLESLD